VANPDGYDHTFASPENRLWRKNLRDNDGDGELEPYDGVDPNRNFPTRWGYDDEGSSPAPSGETFRGPAPASEPETRALDALLGLHPPALPPQLPLLRAAHPLPDLLTGSDRPGRRADLHGPRRHGRAPGDRGLRPRPGRRPLHQERRHRGPRLHEPRVPRLHRRAGRGLRQLRLRLSGRPRARGGRVPAQPALRARPRALGAGRSEGWEEWSVDLSRYAGRRVELSISYGATGRSRASAPSWTTSA
jgi:hypothetical protein